MRVLVLSQYYKPEQVGPAIWLAELVADLKAAGESVTVLTSFPNHPDGVIAADYRHKVFQQEVLDGVRVVRTYIYATPSKGFWRRLLSFGSFIITSLIGGIFALTRQGVVYAVLPPLPLGVTAVLLGRLKSAKVVINLQDIHPDVAVATDVLRNRGAIRFFQWMEKWIYRHADALVVISEGFRQNLLAKAVPDGKIRVIPNWADPDFVRPGENRLLREQCGSGKFAVVYSGGLTHNSALEPLIDAADILREEPFSFVIHGDGVKKRELQQRASTRKLQNLSFHPFVPLEQYPAVLSTAAMNVVTLHGAAAVASVPSKIFKMMASGRPVLAIAAPESEIARLVAEAQCGICVPPGEPEQLAEALRYARSDPEQLDEMGARGRKYLEQNMSRNVCTRLIHDLLCEMTRTSS